MPDSEASPRAKHHTFSAKYKLRIVEGSNRCPAGKLDALLRRE
jgi:hypothetical protein